MKKMSYKKAAMIYRARGANTELCNDFAEVWCSNEYLEKAPVPSDWQKHVTIWGYFGLIREDFESFSDSITRAGDGISIENRWRYVCGCAWNVIRIIREIAEEGEDLD